MMADFDAAFDALLINEGGYSNDVHDSGGKTMWGITERVARKNGYQGEMKDLPQAMAKDIAKREYWTPYSCDSMPQYIAFAILDAAYNGGYPALWVQRAVGVKEDGNIGPVTLKAINAANPDKVVMKISAYRLRYLAKLKDWAYFGAGWANRIALNIENAAKG